MSFTALQGATLIACHDVANKLLTTVGVRVYQWLGTDKEKVARFEKSELVQQAQKAQLNSAEYSAFLITPLLFFHLAGVKVDRAATLSVIGQVGYYWVRIFFGYPALPTAIMASIRYGGLILLCADMVEMAFGKSESK